MVKVSSDSLHCQTQREEDLRQKKMIDRRGIRRNNTIDGEDEQQLCIDGSEYQEYEIDDTFLTSVRKQHTGNNTCFSFSNSNSYHQSDVVTAKDNHVYEPVVEPLELSKRVVTITVFTGSNERNMPIMGCESRYRERSGEHKRKVQRQTSAELQDINRNLFALDIDSSYVDEILKQDQDGDNLIATAIILNKTRLACRLTDLIPCYSLLNDNNDMFQTLIHLATLTNNATMVRRLIVAGANITVRDRHGNTPLHIACSHGYVEVVKALLEPVRYPETKENVYQIPYQKIPQDLEIRNAQGLTCLLICADKTDITLIEMLLSKCANINAHDMKNGKTCLHIFSEVGNLDAVNFLTSLSGLDINRRTYSSFTAAELASYRGHDAIVTQLLLRGCDPNIRSITSGEFDADPSDSE